MRFKDEFATNPLRNVSAAPTEDRGIAGSFHEAKQSPKSKSQEDRAPK